MQFEDQSLAPYQGDKPYIFLSYSHRDAAAAADIIGGMNRDGFRVWYDEGLVPGKEWDENIARAIMGCSYFVALMSANYLESANCKDELNFARDKKLPLLLLYLEDVDLPMGMDMRLGRMLAIHRHKFTRPESFFAKVRAAEGISVCRDVPEEEAAAEAEESIPRADHGQPPRRSLSKAIKLGVPAALIAVLALILLLGRGKKADLPSTPAVTDSPQETAEIPPEESSPAVTVPPMPTEAPAVETPTPTEAPAAETPTPTEAPAVEETALPEAETPAPTPLSEEELAYQQALALRDAGKPAAAALALYQLGDYKDAQTLSHSLWQSLFKRSTVSTGPRHSIGLKEDGSVYFAGEQTNGKLELSGWGDLIAVSAGTQHSLGLKADGTVVSKGLNAHGERSLSAWKNIVSIVAGNEISIGLCADGTVVARGDNSQGQCDVEQWRDIVAVDVGLTHTVGLRADGTVEAVGSNNNHQRDVEDWTDIVAVAAGYYHTLGLKADGTVVAVGYNAYGQCDVSGWTDIVAIAAGKRHSVGLKADGTVVAVGYNSSGECDVQGWTDIIEIECGEAGTLALRRDGTAVACGNNEKRQLDVNGWTELRIPAHSIG